MKTIPAFLVALLCASGAWAQTTRPTAIVVANCGTAPTSLWTAGSEQRIVQDVNGDICIGPVTATIADGGDATLGTKADAAWSGSGSGSVVAVLKAIWTKLGAVVATINGTYNATPPTLTDTQTAGTQMGVNGAIVTQPQDAVGASFQSLTATTATTLVTLSPAQTAGYSKLELNYIAASGGSAIIVETSWDNFVTAAVTMTGFTSGNNGNTFTSLSGTTPASFRLSGPYVRIRTTSVTSGTATVQFALRSGSVLDNISATLTANGGSPTIVSQGKTASGATANENPLYDGGRAENAEATAVTNGQKVGAAYDLVGRPINFPFANKENLVTGTVALTDTTSTLFIASAGGALFNYLNGISCTNAGTAGVSVTLKNGNGGTTVWQAYVAPNGGGIVDNPPTPITGIQNMTVATAIFIVLGGSPSGTVYCNGRGFKGT